jgi:hypothetical protein
MRNLTRVFSREDWGPQNVQISAVPGLPLVEFFEAFQAPEVVVPAKEFEVYKRILAQ